MYTLLPRMRGTWPLATAASKRRCIRAAIASN
jgi:hypothetical protein